MLVICGQDSQGSEVAGHGRHLQESSAARGSLRVQRPCLRWARCGRCSLSVGVEWSRKENRKGKAGDHSGLVTTEGHEKPLESFEQRSDMV